MSGVPFLEGVGEQRHPGERGRREEVMGAERDAAAWRERERGRESVDVSFLSAVPSVSPTPLCLLLN